MSERRRRGVLWTVKAVHSMVFLVMLGAIGWLVASGIVGRRDRTVGVAAALVAGQSAVFVLNSGTCPLTTLAERYGASRGGVSDIFLPDAVARTIPLWSTTLIAIGVSIHVRGLARQRPLARASVARPAARRTERLATVRAHAATPP